MQNVLELGSPAAPAPLGGSGEGCVRPTGGNAGGDGVLVFFRGGRQSGRELGQKWGQGSRDN